MYEDDLEKKKKLDAFKAFIAYYLLVVQEQEKNKLTEWKASVKNLFEDMKEKPEEKLKDDINMAYAMYAAMEYSHEKLHEMFKLDPNNPEDAEIEESLKTFNLSNDSYASLCFAACDEDDAVRLTQHLAKCGQDETPEAVKALDQIRDKAVLKAREAILDVKKNGGVILAKMINGGLRIACEHFATAVDKKEAIQWSMHAKEMIDILRKDPKLIEMSGLTQAQLNIAEEVAMVGENIKEGLKAVEMMAHQALSNGADIPQKEKEEYLKSIMKMQVSLQERPAITKEWDKEEPELAPNEIPAVNKLSGKDDPNKAPENNAPEISAPVVTNH